MSDTFGQARQHFLDGLAQFEAGRIEQAEAHFEAALALVPGRVSTLVNLGATRIRLGRPDAALPLLAQALAAEPDDADAWMHRGIALAELGRHGEALLAFERQSALRPDDAQAWTNRASVLKALSRRDEAAAAYRQAMAHGGDAALNSYYLAALTGADPPRTPPRRYVERLFDDYAETFDAHLVGALGYRAHRLMLEPLQGQARRFRHALDLGCGTGLCGALIRAVAARADGVDLSAAMLAKARALGVYGQLEQADLVAHLGHTDQRHDLVVAADVFIYVGALEAVFSGVQRVLEPGGTFCFSAEQATGDADFELRPSLRYAHSERYLRAVAAQSGFDVERMVSQPIREDQRRPIPGLYAYLRAGADPFNP